METDFSKAIKDILTRSFPEYTARHINKVADRIFAWTGKVDYRSKYVEMCYKDMETKKEA